MKMSRIGFTIHRSCLVNWGDDHFINNVDITVSSGISCMNKLYETDYSIVSETIEYLPTSSTDELLDKRLEALVRSGRVVIYCNETQGYNYWSSDAGHASLPENTKNISYNLDNGKQKHILHPFISVNPHNNCNNSDVSFVAKTIFHELFHNLGYTHESAFVEYAYTSEQCCERGDLVNYDIYPECRICSGRYKDSTDKGYISDYVEWGQNYSRSVRQMHLVSDTILGYVLQQPIHSTDAYWGMAKYCSLWNYHMFSSVTTVLSVELSRTTGFDTYHDLLAIGIRNSRYAPYLSYENVTRYSYVISNATYLYFVERDARQTLVLLEQNKLLLCELSNPDVLNSNWSFSKSVHEYMCKHLMKLLYIFLYRNSFSTDAEKELKSRALSLSYDVHVAMSNSTTSI